MNGLHHIERGAGPPLLLIHGTGCDADVWEAVLPSLAARHRVIAYDRRGFGRSPGPAPTGAGAFAVHADDARALLDALTPAEPAFVVGWSGGGIVALHLALSHPRRVRALVLVEPPLWARKRFEPRMLVGMVRVMWHAARGRPQQAAAAFFRTVTPYRDGRGNGFDALGAAQRQARLGRAESVLAEIRAGTGEELTPERLAQLRCPTTLVLGARSPAFFDALARGLGAVVPALRTVHIAGAGHIPMVEAPAAFADAVFGANVSSF
jgi:pimeloyl-ACP methyl ester carboxylesterase